MFRVDKYTISLPRGGKTNMVCLITDRPATLVTDPCLRQKGMVHDAGGLLIDQSASEQLLGRPAGLQPVDYLADYPLDSLIVNSPGHFGWQNGCAMTLNGLTVTMPTDSLPLSQTWLGQTHAGYWTTSSDPDMLEWGWSGPYIVRHSEAVPLSEIIDDVRLRADARNVFVFNVGEVPGAFFQLIRPLLPTSAEQLRMLLAGQTVVVQRQGALSADQYGELSQIISQSKQRHLHLSQQSDGHQILVIEGHALKPMRMPLTSLGYNLQGHLIAVVVDGRQPGSDGCTIEELADIMVAQGAINATLGGGGGDVGMAWKVARSGVVQFINTPSNRDAQGNLGAPRRVPNALIIPA